jgi:hypothetical protein
MRRVPEFFIVGQPKCGTTALYHTLKRHPQIYMPSAKEPNFFSGEWLTSTGAPQTLDDYLALFDSAAPEQRLGEASVFYLMSDGAAHAIAQAQPSARILAILREPASLLHSLHLQFLQSDFETEGDLRKALSLEDRRRQGKDVPRFAGNWWRRLLYSEHVRYMEQLGRYHAAFPPEQIMVLVYDDFRRDNQSVVRQVLSFLGVDDGAPLEVGDVNPTVRVRSQRLNRLAFREQGAFWSATTTAAKLFMPTRVRHRVRESWYRFLYDAPPPPDERLMTDLRRRFKPEVAALGEYLKRDLITLWGYDTLG